MYAIDVLKRYDGTNYKCRYDNTEEWMFRGPDGRTHYHAGRKEGYLGIEENDSPAVYLVELDANRDIVGVKEFDHELHFLNIKQAIAEYESERYCSERDDF